jgi:uncharacterized membrane protein YczE
MKKIPLGELAFVIGVLLTCAGVALMVRSDLGLSMVAAPAYILTEKIDFLTTGMAEWGIQGTLFVLGCILVRRFSVPMLLSFLVAAVNAAVLDLMLFLSSSITPVSFAARLAVWFVGLIILALGIAFAFRSYLPCQMHEMFVKTVADERGWNRDKCKIVYDWIFLAVSLTLSLCFFRRLVGIGIGTVLATFLNGPLIMLWGKVLDRFLNFEPAIPAKKN